MRRRTLIILAAVVVLPVVVLAVEVQLARTATRLDDEDGFRPTGLRLDRAPTAAPPLHVVWLGDSTAAGVGATSVEQSMAAEVAAGLGADADRGVVLSQLGVSGAQVHEVLDDQLPQLDTLLADVADGSLPPLSHVFVSIGANDVTALTRRPTFTGRYRELVDRLVDTLDLVDEADAPELVLVGIPDMGTAPRLPVPLRQIAGLRAAQLDDVIADIAGDRLITHVDLAARTSATFSSDPDRFFAGDDFHPSDDGHQIWADAVLDVVREARPGR